ncbi:MAG: response regulator [Actinophytocola sp.]|nr:response regulator [Actinophytocola sp.]
MNDRLRVVIVDDHDLFGQGLALLLSAKAGERFEVAGHTTRVEEAAPLVERTGAELAIVDLAMPPLGGAAAIRQIKRLHPDTRVLALSGADDRELAVAALHAGADGYLPKSADPETLVAPLQTLAAGFAVLEHRLLTAILGAPRTVPPELLSRLDPQEVRLWQLLSRGIDNAEIARRMLVSERTAKRMVASVLHKIGTSNRIEAAALAGRYGLLDRE